MRLYQSIQITSLWLYFHFCTLVTSESPRHHEHSGWRLCYHARCGWGSRPDPASEAPDADWNTRALQQLEPRVHHSPLCWKGTCQNSFSERKEFNFEMIVGKVWLLCIYVMQHFFKNHTSNTFPSSWHVLYGGKWLESGLSRESDMPPKAILICKQ